MSQQPTRAETIARRVDDLAAITDHLGDALRSLAHDLRAEQPVNLDDLADALAAEQATAEQLAAATRAAFQ